MTEYRTMMFINDDEVSGSAIANGTKAHCESVAARLNKRTGRHPSVSWRALPCL